MNRRSLLVALASGTAALAGCFGDSETEQPDITTPTPTEETGSTDGSGDGSAGNGESQSTPAPTVNVRVGDVAIVPEVVALDTPDSIGTFGRRDQQYVLANILTPGKQLERAQLGLFAAQDVYAPEEQIGESAKLWGYGDQYFATEGESGWIVFEIPNPTDVYTATIAWNGGANPIDDAVGEPMRRGPASFDVTVDAPAEVETGSTVPLSVTVENTSDVDGTFVGAVNRIGPSSAYAPETAIELDVAAGETGTWEYSYEPEGGVDGDLTVEVVWRDGEQRREITAVDGSGESGEDSEDNSDGDGSGNGSDAEGSESDESGTENDSEESSDGSA